MCLVIASTDENVYTQSKSRCQSRRYQEIESKLIARAQSKYKQAKLTKNGTSLLCILILDFGLHIRMRVVYISQNICQRRLTALSRIQGLGRHSLVLKAPLAIIGKLCEQENSCAGAELQTASTDMVVASARARELSIGYRQ